MQDSIRYMRRRALRIALLEDDQDFAELLSRWLQEAGSTVVHCTDSREFMQLVKRESFDLLILDWLVPDVSGLDVLQWVREYLDWRIPVLFVTQVEAEDDIVKALGTGADDYMTKPVGRRELLARVSALGRRCSVVDQNKPVMVVGPYELDQENRLLMKDHEVISLTRKEFDLVHFLFRNIGRVLSRGHILESVWGRTADVQTRTVDTHISRIRAKLGLTEDQGFRLSSIYQHGYRLERLNGNNPSATHH